MRTAVILPIFLASVASLDCGNSNVDVWVHCAGADGSIGAGYCAHGWSACSDGHRYEIACSDTAHSPHPCTCTIDRATTKTITTSSICSAADAQADLAACGFPIR